MAFKQIAEGGTFDFGRISRFEPEIAEGQRGRLDMDLRLPVSLEGVNLVRDGLARLGVPELKVARSRQGRQLNIGFRKGIPVLGLIAAIIIGILIVAALIITWRLFVEVAEVLGSSVLKFAAIGLGVLLIGIGLSKASSGIQEVRQNR